ncbi:hypothetical protein PAXRUDRAFT_142070, partial [Paxillus rubicundulus Ve08.2h10]
LNLEQIAMCLNTSTCTVKRALSYFHTYGMVPNPGDSMHCNYSAYDMETNKLLEFLLGIINKTPNLYLDELHEMFAVSCGVNISCAIIWRTLHRTGLTMKKVFLSYICNDQSLFF